MHSMDPLHKLTSHVTIILIERQHLSSYYNSLYNIPRLKDAETIYQRPVLGLLLGQRCCLFWFSQEPHRPTNQIPMQ